MHKQRLARSHRALREECGDDRALFAERWRAFAQRCRFDELNELITQHNEWYPIERDLPMDLRTRDYVLINGRSYRRPQLTPQWVLEQFPRGVAELRVLVAAGDLGGVERRVGARQQLRGGLGAVPERDARPST